MAGSGSASGLIVAYLPRVGMVWLAVNDAKVADSCRLLRYRIPGGCARTAWKELRRQAYKVWWFPADSRQEPVCWVPRRDASTAMTRLRRAHARLGARPPETATVAA